jgi:hypothetical protein
MKNSNAQYAAQQTLLRVMRFVNRPFTEAEQRQALEELQGQSTRPYGKIVGRVFDSPVTFTARERMPEMSAPLCDWAEKAPSLVQKQAFIDGFLGRVTIEPEALDDRTDGSRYEEAVHVRTIYVNTARECLPEDLEADCKELGYVVPNTEDPREIERLLELISSEADEQLDKHLWELREARPLEFDADLLEAYMSAVKYDKALKPLWERGCAPPLQKLRVKLTDVLDGLKRVKLVARFSNESGTVIRSFDETTG